LREREGVILNELGIVATDLGKYDAARTAFESAVALYRGLGQTDRLAESLAGLADVSHSRGDSARARTAIDEILGHLESAPELLGAERPFRVHLICYQVLHSAGDARAEPVLERAYNLLQARASRIPDEAVRRSFLEKVATHREIVRVYGAVFGN
jgi:tetratricopeptide (TPR) repeat protein